MTASKTKVRPGVSLNTPLGSGNLREIGGRMGFNPRLVEPLMRKLGIPVQRCWPEARVDLGQTTIADLQATYLSLLPSMPLLDRVAFGELRKNWAQLQLPTGVAVECVVDAAERYLDGKSKHKLEPMAWLLPFDRDAIRRVLEKSRKKKLGVRTQQSWIDLPPRLARQRIRIYEATHVDPDPRLDANVAIVLGCQIQHLDALYGLGLIERDTDVEEDGRRRASLQPLLDLTHLRTRLATSPPTITAENTRHYRVVRAGLSLGDADHHPKSVVADVLRMLAHMNAVPSPTTISQIIGGDPHQFVDDLINWGIETGKPVRWWREWRAVRWNPALEDLRAATHPDAPLTLTALDKVSGSPALSPSTASIRQVLAITNREDQIRAAIVALEGKRMGIVESAMDDILRAVRHILPLMAGLDPWIPHHVNTVLGPYALLSDHSGLDERRRLHDVDRFHAACEISASWFNRLKPEERPAAERFKLAMPSGAATLFPAVEKRIHELKEEAADERDDRLAPWVGDPDRVIALMLQKASRTFDFFDTANEVIAYADGQRSTGEWNGDGPVYWFHPEKFADIGSDGCRIDQRILFSIETWQSKCNRINAIEGSGNQLWKRFSAWLQTPLSWRKGDETRSARNADLSENRYVVAIHGVVANEPGEPTSPPHWYQIFKGCVLETANRVPPELAAERLEAIRLTGVHNTNLQLRGSFADYAGKPKRTIARHAREVFGEVCFPVHEFTHGTALAAFSASARYDLPERSQELSQTDLEDDKWEEWKDPETEEAYGIFKIIRKKHSKVSDFIFSPTTLTIMKRLASLASARLFDDGEWPLVRPTEAMRRGGFGPSTYLITDGRDVIGQSVMAGLFRILVGSPELGPADVKHLLNAISRREGVPIEIRRRWNFHKSAKTTEGYGRESREEKAGELMLFLRMVQARRSAVGRAGGEVRNAGGLTKYVTRREQLADDRELAASLAAVYGRFGRMEELLAQQAEMHRLDIELAMAIEGRE